MRVLCGLLIFMRMGQAEAVPVVLDAARSVLQFSLSASLHTVHGTFALKSGTLTYDPESGKASGRLVIDVLSGNTGDGGRDKRMHKDILESTKYPEAVFTPEKVTGSPATGLVVSGKLNIHGASHQISSPVKVVETSADVNVTIPYVEWGMKNPSNFLFKVSDKVEVMLHLVFLKPAGLPSAVR